MNPAPYSNSNSFLGFVPSMVIQHLHEKGINGEKTKLPEKQSLKSVVMFADISGFTNLTETLSKRGPEGAEIIAFAINRYMELMVKEIGRSGGDIFKFAGDAMIVVWPPPKKEGQLQNTCRQAIQAALSIQSKLDNMNITDGVKLSVKIGFGVGDFSIIYVGGIFGRAEYLPAGDPLTQAFSAEHEAESGGVINCSQQIFDFIKDHFDVEIKNAAHKIYQVKKVKEKVMVKADAMMIKDKMRSQDIERIKTGVMAYVPRSLQAYIQYEQEQWSSELRLATIMFMNIGIDLSDCADSEGLNKIQKVIENIQKCVYMYEGSLNKFLMDDKGSTLIVVFGLPPITHQDDAVRAVLCSFAIRKQLKKENCKCSIGIGTGLVFAGVVGTSGNRREYSVIGDSVNLSARIMQKACYEKEDQFKILCSYTTVQQAQSKISFKFRESCKFKGKSIYLPIFYPLDLSNKELSEMDRENKFPSLRTHMFSFPMDPDDKPKKMSYFSFMKGMQKEFQEGTDFVKKFLDSSIPKGCLIIGGDMGIGKSLFLRKLIYNIQENVDKNKKFTYKYNERPNIIVSNLDPSNKFKKMNIMRSILKQIIEIIEQRVPERGAQNINVTQFLNNCNFQSNKLKSLDDRNGSSEQTKKDLEKRIADFKEICGLTEYNYVENFPPPFNTLKQDEFISKHKQEKRELSKLAIELFSIYFDQPLKNRKQSETSGSSLESAGNSRLFRKDPKDSVAPLILCLEDLQYADAFSYQVLSSILKKFNRVMIIGAMRTSSLEKPSFPNPFLPSQEKLNQKGIEKFKKNLFLSDPNCIEEYDSNQKVDYFHMISIKGLKMDKIKSIIREVFNLDKIAFIENKSESGDNSQITSNQGGQSGQHSDQNNHHNQQGTQNQKNKLNFEKEIKAKIEKYEKDSFSYLFFSKIKNDLLHSPEHFFHNFLYLKTQGNPLQAINLIENLLRQKLLIIKDENIKPKHEDLEDEIHNRYNYEELDNKTGYITSHLKKAIMLEDLITIDVPLCKNNINTPVIDKLGCLDLLILKIASVIGDIFDLQTLSKVHPFGNVIKSDKLVETLQNLCQQNFLEVVDQNENNVYYRFCNSFVRETLYQRLIYTQRRQIHLIVAEALQNQISLPHNQDDDIEKLKYQWLLGENTKDISVTDLPHKAKRSIIVKKIQSQLTESQSSANTIIKQDYLVKKSDFSKYSWSTRYVVMSTKDIRYYYTNEDFQDKPEDFLGAIPLRFIYEVNMLDPKEYKRKDYPFIIKASTWFKKAKQQSKRDFFFSAASKEEYEEWYIYLNIAKTKAMQDEFHREYGKVNILKGGLEIDITLKTFLEQKRVQAVQKVEPSRNRRKTISSSIKSPLNKTREKEKKALEVENNETLNLNQQKEQGLLKNNIEQFIKRGMILFFSHLFQQSVHPDGSDQFGDVTPDIYKKLNLSKINRSNLNYGYRSQTSLSQTEKDHEQLTQKTSVELDILPDLSNIHNTPIQNTLSSSLSPHIINATLQQSNIEPDSNGHKKRVTIYKNITSENSSPSHKPKMDTTPVKRKSILMKIPVPVSSSSGIVDSINFQTPVQQDHNLLNINQKQNEGGSALTSGNSSFRKLDSLEQITQGNPPTQIVLNKVNYENFPSDNKIEQNYPSSNNININSNNQNNNQSMSNNYEFPPKQQQNNYMNGEKQRQNSKPLMNSKPPLSQQTNPQQNNGNSSSSNSPLKSSDPSSQKTQTLEFFNDLNVSPIQHSMKGRESLIQQQSYRQGNQERGEGSNQQTRRGESYQQDQSPPTPNKRSISPHAMPNSGRQQFAKNGNIIDLKRSSTQSTLPLNMNVYSNGTNSYYVSNALNANEQSKTFSNLFVDSNNNYRNSQQSSPLMNHFSNNIMNQNSFYLQNNQNNEMNGRSLIQQNPQMNTSSQDLSLIRNQFDDTNLSLQYQNQFNNSQIRHPELSRIQFTSKKQNDSFNEYNDDQFRGKNLSNPNNSVDLISKRINSITSMKKPYQYDNYNKQSSQISISNILNKVIDEIKAQALVDSYATKGEMTVQKGRIYTVSISSHQQDLVKVYDNNRSGIFKRSIFNFINNPELNQYSQQLGNSSVNESSGLYQKNKEQDNYQMNNSQLNDYPLRQSINILSQENSNSQQLKARQLSSIAPIYLYQKQIEMQQQHKNSIKNNVTQYY